MRIAVAQVNPISGDIRANEKMRQEYLERAEEGEADVVVFPEAQATGYCIGDLVEDEDFLAANRESIERTARRTGDMAVVAGFIDYDPSERNEDGNIRKFNAAAGMQGGRIAGVARKSLLANYRYFDDKRYFSPAERREPIRIGYRGGEARLGVSICEDAWDNFYLIKPIPELARRGADIIININASPFYPGKRHIRDGILRRHVLGTGRPLVYVNTAGAGDNGKNIIPFDGQSMVYDAAGNLVALGKQFEEDLFFVDLNNPGRPVELPPVEWERELYGALVMGLKDYAYKKGFRTALVPVSGGIDSCMGLAIAAEAFGPQNVTAYNLPSRFNKAETRLMAEMLAGNFGVNYGAIPIQRISDVILEEFERYAHEISDTAAGRNAKDNVHARIRGLLMMLESNDKGQLLISCGNETEIALGYATLYGDMCGGVSVIGDLSKTDVYRVAGYVNRLYGREMIPYHVFEIKPSAELHEDQYDPFDYYVTAPLVGEMLENRRSPAKLAEMFKKRELDLSRFLPDREGRTVYDKHTAESFECLAYDTYRQLKNSVYKRLQGPPIIAVSQRAFGFDFREPIINGWEGTDGA